jgi:hypothetical protein
MEVKITPSTKQEILEEFDRLDQRNKGACLGLGAKDGVLLPHNVSDIPGSPLSNTVAGQIIFDRTGEMSRVGGYTRSLLLEELNAMSPNDDLVTVDEAYSDYTSRLK